VGQVLQPVAHQALLALHLVGERIAGPVGLQRLRGGDEGQVVAAERAAVGARLPDVQFGLHQHQRHGQSETGQRLRQRDDVGLDPGRLETEEAAGTAAADLDIVDDHQHVVATAQLLQVLQPAQRRDVDPALALHGLDDHRGRLVQPAAGIVQHALDVGDGVDVRAEVAVIRHERGISQRYARRVAELGIGRRRQRAAADAVEPVGERDDVRTPLDLPGQLQRRLDRVGARRAGELQGVLPVARLEQHAVHRFEKALLGAGGHVQAVYHAVGVQILQQAFLEDRIVMAVVQRAGAAEEIDVLVAFLIDQQRTACLAEYHWKRPNVAPHFRLHSVKDFQVHKSSLHIS